MKLFGWLLLVTLSCWATVCGAAEGDLYKEYQMPERFSVKIPKNWSKVPQKEIDDLYAMRNKNWKRPKKTGFEFLYGFREGSKKYPSVFVQVYRKGKVTKKQLQMLAGKLLTNPEAINKEKARIISLSSQDKKVYDPEDHILWNSLSYQTGDGEVARLTVKKFTSEGFIILTFSSLLPDYKKNVKIFQTMAESLTIDPALEYSPS